MLFWVTLTIICIENDFKPLTFNNLKLLQSSVWDYNRRSQIESPYNHNHEEQKDYDAISLKLQRSSDAPLSIRTATIDRLERPKSEIPIGISLCESVTCDEKAFDITVLDIPGAEDNSVHNDSTIKETLFHSFAPTKRASNK